MKKALLFPALVAFAFSLNAQELINDGAFDTYEGVLTTRTADEWGAWSDNGSVVEVVSGIAECTPGAATPEDPWHGQLEQWGAAVENGLTYTVSFLAWADFDRSLQLTIEDPSNNYRRLGETPDADGEAVGDVVRSKWTIDITTEETTYTRTVTIDSVMENTSVKFAFLYTATLDVVYIDDVSLQEQISSINGVSVLSMNVFPNPTDGELNISNEVNVANIEVLNVLGQTIIVVNESTNILDVSSLSSGVYIIKVTDDNNNVYISKFKKM
ncbi:MAG: T9SS type A sorting domain-containing protein [Bacteroidales bacterium]|nr:T9SS type A sorting domain-containing protein [Bacteroidales bacterium]